MKITSIKQQVKLADRYSLYVDDEYAFSLSERVLMQSGLHSGLEITAEQLEEYKRMSTDDKLFNRALRYVSMRLRTSWELETYLRRKEASPEFIASTVERFNELGLLNDAAYADSFVRDRQLLRPTSKRKLELELKRKHISESVIRNALEENEFNEHVSLEQLIMKKRRQTKYQDDEKLMQYLARQGYGYGDIKSALGKDY